MVGFLLDDDKPLFFLKRWQQEANLKKNGGKGLPEHITNSLHFSKGLCYFGVDSKITEALDDQLQNQAIETCHLICHILCTI